MMPPSSQPVSRHSDASLTGLELPAQEWQLPVSPANYSPGRPARHFARELVMDKPDARCIPRDVHKVGKNGPCQRLPPPWTRPHEAEKLRYAAACRVCSAPQLVEGVLKQVGHLRDLVGDVPVTGALCFVEADWPLLGGAFATSGIHVLWPKRLAKLPRRRQTAVLTPPSSASR